MSTQSREDSAGLLRKSIYQALSAALVVEGVDATSYAECRDAISDSPKLGRLFEAVLSDLPMLDQLHESYDLVLDKTTGQRGKYDALLKRMPQLHRQVRHHLDDCVEAAGFAPRTRRQLGWAALVAAAVAVFAMVYSVSTGALDPPTAGPPPPPAPEVGAPGQPADPQSPPDPAKPPVRRVDPNDPRPEHVQLMFGADAEPVQIRPDDKLTVNREQMSVAVMARLFVEGSPGAYRLRAFARGTVCKAPKGSPEEETDPAPTLELYLDGQVQRTFHVASEQKKSYPSDRFTLDDKRHVIDLVFTNDYADDRCDRNLWLDEVELVTEP
jgi:hypothetical protein